MILYLAFALLGIAMGTFTGLIPGVHVNNIAPLLVGLAAGRPWARSKRSPS